MIKITNGEQAFDIEDRGTKMGKVMKGRLFERLVFKMLNNFSAHRTVSC
jgi:hypothetical protein